MNNQLKHYITSDRAFFKRKKRELEKIAEKPENSA